MAVVEVKRKKETIRVPLDNKLAQMEVLKESSPWYLELHGHIWHSREWLRRYVLTSRTTEIQLRGSNLSTKKIQNSVQTQKTFLQKLHTSNFFAISPGLIISFLFKTSKVGGGFPIMVPRPSSKTSSIYPQ